MMLKRWQGFAGPIIQLCIFTSVCRSERLPAWIRTRTQNPPTSRHAASQLFLVGRSLSLRFHSSALPLPSGFNSLRWCALVALWLRTGSPPFIAWIILSRTDLARATASYFLEVFFFAFFVEVVFALILAVFAVRFLAAVFFFFFTKAFMIWPPSSVRFRPALIS